VTDNDKITFLRRRPSRLLPLQASISFNTWNDYNYLTSFHLDICDIHGNEHPIGRVKIAQFGMGPGASSVPDTFTELDHEFFSLGQSDTYYQRLNFLGAEVREHVLRSLRDIAADTELFERAKQEEVTKYSLLRGITPMTVRGQFHRMAWGGARLSPYNFSYQAPVPNCQNPLNLSFEVKPESNPPTNIHVLIGRNGVGKTFLLHHMTRAFIGKKTSYNQEGRLSFTNIGGVEVLEGDFANIVTVTFSAFDDFPPIEEQNESATDVKYSYIGLKDQSSKRDSFGIPMTPEQLAEKFRDSVVKCSGDDRRLRLQSALEMLSADPGFKKVDVTFLTDDHNDLDIATQALTLFKLLSSGHKIVLLTYYKVS
jgi:hypothetical protein